MFKVILLFVIYKSMIFAGTLNTSMECYDVIYPNVEKYSELKNKSKSKLDQEKYRKIEMHYKIKFDECVERMGSVVNEKRAYTPYRSNAQSVGFMSQF
jgi:hypothetical protein